VLLYNVHNCGQFDILDFTYFIYVTNIQTGRWLIGWFDSIHSLLHATDVVLVHTEAVQQHFVMIIFVQARKDAVIADVKWFYRVTELPEAVYLLLMQDRRNGIEHLSFTCTCSFLHIFTTTCSVYSLHQWLWVYAFILIIVLYYYLNVFIFRWICRDIQPS